MKPAGRERAVSARARALAAALMTRRNAPISSMSWADSAMAPVNARDGEKKNTSVA